MSTDILVGPGQSLLVDAVTTLEYDTGIIAPETQPHFIGKYRVSAYPRLRYHAQFNNADPLPGGGFPILIDDSGSGAILVESGVTLDYDASPIQPSTRVDVIARYKIERYASPRLYFGRDVDGGAPGIDQPSTDVEVIARYRASRPQRFLFNSRDESEGATALTAESGANAHFIARYNPGKLQSFQYNNIDVQGPAPEVSAESTPVNVLGKYTIEPLRIAGRYLHRDIDFNAVGQPQPSTEIYALAKYQQEKYKIFGRYGDQDYATGADFVGALSTEIYFTGRYQTEKLRFFRQGTLHAVDVDVIPPQPAIAPSVIAKYDILSLHYIKVLRLNPDIIQTKPHVEPPPAVPAARVIIGHPAVPLWQPTSPQTWIARIGDISRTSLAGHVNVTLTVTLNTGMTTTDVIDVRISINSGLILVPQTSNAAAIHASVYVSAQKSGQATLTHTSTGNADCTFNLVIIG